MGNFTTQALTCKDCGQAFEWTAEEQEFYASKQLSAPQRCKPCRQAKRQQFGGSGSSGPRVSTPITCSKCGKQDSVPFVPRDTSTVLCKDCFKTSRG